MGKLKTANQILNIKYGKKGTPLREKYTEEAYAFYLSEILKARRKELKMTQEELAIKVGKKRPYISRVENGEDVRLSNFVQIARVLGLNFKLTPN
ncbi:helix-turn-helix transcriptional regulator [Saprospiraceae bacterium]|nr:helix-turn-helix transcriptional regulator [Saprospiraceae bacterium]